MRRLPLLLILMVAHPFMVARLSFAVQAQESKRLVVRPATGLYAGHGRRGRIGPARYTRAWMTSTCCRLISSQGSGDAHALSEIEAALALLE